MVREAAVVAQRCMEAQESGFINLSGCGLMTVPDALYLFLKNSQVKSIDLSDNQLTKIPIKLAKAFPHVKELNVANNVGIDSLPIEFGACEELSVVNLSGNKFSALPSIAFRSLKSLNLSNNLLENITEADLAAIGHVEEINLTENKLSDDCKSKLKSISNILL